MLLEYTHQKAKLLLICHQKIDNKIFVKYDSVMKNIDMFSSIASTPGLSHEQQQVYIAMLELESVSVRKVAAASGLNRGLVYETLKELVEIGLVGMRPQGKRDYYFAESPERLHILLQERRKELWQAQNLAKEVVPELLSKTAHRQGMPVVKYYEDDDGVATILRDVLQTCERLNEPKYLAYSAKPLRHYLYRKFKDYTEKRIASGITVHVIAAGKGGEHDEYSERRWVDDSAGSASYLLIYGDKVAHISITDQGTPYGVVIEDSSVAAMQRMLFERLWHQL